ncbi:MAG: hypothetical protein ABIJ59_01225 [Pseudomonadota bacterium]
MINIKISCIKSIFIFCFFIIGFLFTPYVWADEGSLYAAHNIWYEFGKENKLFCINYKAGTFIPAGTQVKNVKIEKTSAARRSNRESLAIYFETAKDSKPYWVIFTTKWHPGKTIEDYKNYMFSTKNFESLVKGFNKSEIDAIKQGGLVVGMSKKAVLVSYGHPPEHKTPSLDMNRWIYWMSRMGSKAINFDKDGRTFISNTL